MRSILSSCSTPSRVVYTLAVVMVLGGRAWSAGIPEAAAKETLSLPVLAEVLPDAPEPGLSLALPDVQEISRNEEGTSSSLSAPAAPYWSSGAQVAPLTSSERDKACQSETLHGKPCRVSWAPLLWEAFEATALQNVGNIALDTETRQDLRGNPYWSTYVFCVDQFRYNQWRDDDDFMVDYIGHGMQGAGVAALFEQNDPRGRGLVYVNNGNYWRSRLKAMAFGAVYEVQWKLGPAGEASVGNSGLHTYYTPDVHGRTTNETGFQDLVDTPLVGFWWNVGEDAMDRFVMPKIWSRTHNRFILTGLFFLTPCKAAANIMRYKPLYYRDFTITPIR